MYDRVQKPSSSWNPSIQKKKSSKYGPRTFTVQPRRETKSSQTPVPSYSPDAANKPLVTFIGSKEAPVQRQADAETLQPKLEQQTAPVEEAVAVQQSQEVGIQRVCSECQEEEKDPDEMLSVAGVQAKLTVGAPGDKYEQEADRVALQVMAMPDPVTQPQSIQRLGEEEEALQKQSLADSITPVVQRQEDEEELQTKPSVQRAVNGGANDADSSLESRLASQKGGGSPLPDEVRSFMEPRFGNDFSSVRIHTGSSAVQMNKELHAQAFTHGSDIYFNQGKYNPSSSDGKQLLAHELTHVIQQTGAGQLQAKPLTRTELTHKETPLAKLSATPSVDLKAKSALQLKQQPSPQIQATKSDNKIQKAATAPPATESPQTGQPANAGKSSSGGGFWETMGNLKDMLLKVLKGANDAIWSITKDPVGFLGNLVTGLRQGFQNFVTNITTHLQTGLIGWLTGALGPMGIQMPDNIFSLPGIFSLVTQVLGVTWNYVRSKAVKMFGEQTVSGMENSVEIFQMLANQGPMAMWSHVQEQFTDLKETVIEEIKSSLITQVITAGVKWILGLLNPASAFVKAAMAIYDIVMFFYNRRNQIVELVNAVIAAVKAIASGALDGAAKLVENALARSLPVVIGFLASLLGINGLAKKVQHIVEKIRTRIDAAIDKVLLKAKRLFKGETGKGNKDKAKDTTEDKTKGDPNKRLEDGLAELDNRLDIAAKKNGVSSAERNSIIASVKEKYGFKVLEIREKTQELLLYGEINPKKGKEKKNLRAVKNLRNVRKAVPQALLIPDDETLLTPEQAEAVEAAQEFMNELYRKGSTYGDKSTAFIVMIEQYKGGVGNEPEAVVEGTIHLTKAKESITYLKKELLNPSLPQQAKNKITDEINKLQQALDWAENYKDGKNPKIPRWATQWEEQFE